MADWYLESEDSLKKMVADWEAGTLPKADWTHRTHVAVATCYALDKGAGALDAMREGIIRYNNAVGTANTDTGGYHETITRFWADVIGQYVNGKSAGLATVQAAVAEFGPKSDLYMNYYSYDVLKDTAARKAWVAPDKSA